MNIVTQIFGNIGSSENSLKDLLSILTASIPIVIAIYYSLNFYSNADKEEKIMTTYGYSRKSINLPLILFIFNSSIVPIFTIINNQIMGIGFLEVIAILTISIVLVLVLLFIYFIFSKKFDYYYKINILFIFSYIFIYSFTFIFNKFHLIVFIVSSYIFSIIIMCYFNNILDKEFKNKFFNKLSFYFIILPFFYSNICFFIYSIVMLILQNIKLTEIIENVNLIFIIVYFLLGVLIFSHVYSQYQKISLKKIEITLKKDIDESNQDKYENRIGFIISETNDDIVFETDSVLHRYRKSDIYCIKEYKNSYINILNNMDKSIKTIELYIECITKIKISNSTIDNIIKYDKKIKTHSDILETQLFNLIEVQNNNYISSLKIEPKVNDILQNITNINSMKLIKKNRINNIFKENLKRYLEKMKTNCTEIKNQISDLKQKLQEKEKENQEPPTN